MFSHARWEVPAIAVGALALLVGGCGSSDKKSSSTPAAGQSQSAAPPQTLKLEADEDGGLYFKPSKLTGKAGAVTFVMTNPKSTGKEHGLAVKGNGVDQDGPVVKPGKTATLTATLKPGRYTFYCNYENHAKRGMKGTLTVQ
ncbi:MAG: hypothetical protein QOI65_917 [Thermoleophilaceae bacterium]|nr:hypothetical protein [Thermoleophilaceae bacterium]